MRAATVRDQLLVEMDVARDRLNEAMAGLSEAQLSLPKIDGWSVKDHLTHLTLWHELRFFEISRIAHGGRAGFPITDETGVEHINEQFAANRRPLPHAQVLADLDFAREMVRQAVSTCPEERLALTHYEELGQNGAGHDMEHADMILS